MDGWIDFISVCIHSFMHAFGPRGTEANGGLDFIQCDSMHSATRVEEEAH